MSCANLLADLGAGPGEAFATLLERPGLKIERIVSHGACSPPGFWYDEPRAEWVAVLAGRARLRFADEAAPREMAAGDSMLIAPHRRHRVDWTDPEEPTVWLAVHFDE
jgi:cupin 2 domain-containing protein